MSKMQAFKRSHRIAANIMRYAKKHDPESLFRAGCMAYIIRSNACRALLAK